MSAEPYDAIVVGSGASGSFAAKELCEQGLNVLMLEAGRKVGPEDFDLSLKPKKPPIINIVERARHGALGRWIQVRSMFFRGMLGHFYTSDRDNPYTTPKDAPYIWIRGRQEGGRLHLFGRVLMRWSDDDFKHNCRSGCGVDWPICYDDLEPYYTEVETCLGIYGNSDGIKSMPDGHYVAQQGLTEAEENFKARVQRKWPERRVLGWRSVLPPKSRVYKPLEDALATSNLTIRYHAVAEKIISEGNRATGIQVIDAQTGVRSTILGKHFVLCASPIESVRLLLNSANEEHPNGLGNSSDSLGRYFMDQLPLLCMGSYPPIKGHTTEDSQPKDPFYQNGGGIFVTEADQSEFVYQGSIGRAPTDQPDEPSKLMFFGFGRMQPDPDNRITIDPVKRDRYGIPVPHIRCKMSDQDKTTLKLQEDLIMDTVNNAGGQVEFLGTTNGIREWGRGIYPNAHPIARFLFKRFFPMVMQMGAAIHETGGARMGKDPKTSVLNKWGQSWDISNLYVTDASAFPSSGVSGTTLTIMAQTIRACRHLAGQRKG
ncbi:oxidoreductase [Marivivens niveibacter]|uniref:Oxidoreductase n=1 Tax=Marivivens niveibacter TaxID=1930667 RepID=A0A251X1H6_9RHOB|nr:GMC family oxidoreductase [Marivivens niveibacter]OUD10013.1 oxidoreductase [Marivivens niveibacter]